MVWKQGEFLKVHVSPALLPVLDDGSEPLLIVGVTGQEFMSQPFSFKVLVYSADHKIDPRKLIGKPMSVDIRTKVDGGSLADDQQSGLRNLSGLISNFTYGGKVATRPELRVYRAELIPWFSLLQYNIDCRVFHDMTAREIIENVFERAFEHYIGAIVDKKTAFEFKLSSRGSARLKKLEYCSQFNESDYNFVCRLMEDHGLFYYFHHFRTSGGQNVHTMFIGDDKTAYQSTFGVLGKGEPGRDLLTHGEIVEWEETMSLRMGARAHTDFDPENPDKDIFALIDANVDMYETDHASYHYPGRYKTKEAGLLSAQIRMEDEEARYWQVRGVSTLVNMQPGGTLNYSYLDKDRNPTAEHSPKGVAQDGFVITQTGFVSIDPRLTANGGDEDKAWYEIMLGLGKSTFEAATDNRAGNVLDQIKGQVSNAKTLPVVGGLLGPAAGTLSGIMGAIPAPVMMAVSGLVGLVSALLDRKSKPPTYSNTFTAMPTTDGKGAPISFRAGRTTPRPIVHGPQTAIVVGPNDEISVPAGTDDIHIDDAGRVRVRFHWYRTNRQGQIKQAPHSCFIRVSESWAGPGYGQQFLPRIGNEVIVEFLDGDPDRPIITGAVFNGKSKHPLELQKFKTRAGVKTRSTPVAAGRDKYHMLRFEDQIGKEQVLIRSQRRLDIRAFGSSYHTVGANYHLHVGFKDKDSDESGGGLAIFAGGDHDLHIAKSMYAGIDENYSLAVKGKTDMDLQGGTVMVTPTLDISAKTVHIEAQMEISLKVGSNFVSITPAGVSIKGVLVLINSGGSGSSAKDANVTDPADAAISDTGEPGMLERLRLPAKGGGRKTRNVKHFANNSFFGKNITITGTPEFQEKVVKDLEAIAATPSGAAMIGDLEKTDKKVTINNSPNPNAAQSATTGAALPNADGSKGPGADSTISYNPDQPAVLGPDPWQTIPPGVVLGHELTHSVHSAQGDNRFNNQVQNDSKPDPTDPTKILNEREEEVRTTGIPPYDKEPYSENTLRNEWTPRQDPRPFY